VDVASRSTENRHPKFRRIRVASFRFITAESPGTSVLSTILRDITVQKTIISVFTPPGYLQISYIFDHVRQTGEGSSLAFFNHPATMLFPNIVFSKKLCLGTQNRNFSIP
jgi:hypothetical protein